MRADIFPYHFGTLRHLEEATVAAFADQRIAIGEALRPGNVRAEKIEDRLVGVLPDDVVGARIDLDDAREGGGVVAPVGAVVENQDIAVRQWPRIVLLRQRRGGGAPSANFPPG